MVTKAGSAGRRYTTDLNFLLVEAVKRDGIRVANSQLASSVCRADQAGLVDLVLDQEVAGVAARSLDGLLDPVAATRLAKQVKADLVGHMTLISVLSMAASALDDAGVPWVVMKGPVLTELAYKGLGRPSMDLDLVVPARSFPAVLEAFGAKGLQLIDRNWDLLVAGQRGEVHLKAGPKQFIDLHWHLVNLGPVRQRFRIDVSECLSRRQPVTLAGVDAWSLEPTDSLLHVLFHAALSGGHRLRWLVDIDHHVTYVPPDWPALVRRAKAWGIGLPVATMLKRAQHVLGSAVPEHVISAVAPGAPRQALVGALKDWRPGGRLPGGGSLDRAVTRSLRDTLPQTALQVAADAGSMLQRQWERHEYWSDPNDPRHVLYTNGRQTMADYLAYVSTTDRFGHLARS